MTTYLRPRWPGARPFLLDLAIAVVLSLIVLGSAHWAGPTMWGSFGPTGVQPQPRVYGLLWLATLPVAVRRVVPLWSTALTSVAVLGTVLLKVAPGPVYLVAAFQLASLGSQVPLRVSVPALGTTIVLWLIAAAIAGETLGELAIDLVVWIPLLGVPWALGHVLRIRRRWRGRALAEEERRRAYGQRLEVAREVHDVVGHSLAVITMQSGIALHVMDRRPEQARIALEAIHQQSRDALEELRATLALYRGEPGGEGAPRRPQPRLDDLPALVGTMRSSGLPVELATSGERDGVPAAIDLAGFRIVQESLTNVLRHAGPAHAQVTVCYGPRAIEIEVTDDGSGRPDAAPRPGGHGIAGMRERSAAVGGTLDAEPRQDGGFRVRAQLPLSGAGA